MIVRANRVLTFALAGALAISAAVVGVLAQASPAQAATGAIFGLVEASGGGGPLPDISVSIEQGGTPPVVVTTGPGGDFTATVEEGTYNVFVDGGADYFDAYFEDVFLTSTDATSGDLETITLDPGRKITGIVRDAATNAGLAGVEVSAVGFNGGYVPARPLTDATGAFAITVPLEPDKYLIAANNSDYYPQFYDHLLIPSITACGCAFTVTVDVDGPGAPIDGIDFDLYGYADSIYVSVQTRRANNQLAIGTTVYLEKDVASPPDAPDWQIVYQGTSDTSGLVDLFGIGAGDYRLFVKDGTATRKIARAEEPSCGCGGGGIVYPLGVGNTRVLLSDLTLPPTSLDMPTYLEIDVKLKGRTSGSGGAGTTAAPRNGGVVTGGTTLPSPTASPTPTPLPTETATPTPQPSVTPSSAPSPTSSPAPEPVPTSSVDLWWLWLLIALVLLAIVITIVVLIRRR